MELPALIYLVALIDTGSAAGAAEALGVGSSTVNHAVAALEQAM
ncbi:LysR family transcriptional regulator, partial [Nguyenibacter vanlangensis]